MGQSMVWFAKQIQNLTDALMSRELFSAGNVFIAGFTRDVQGAFNTSSDPANGTPWAPVDRPGKPLILSGTLMAFAVGAASRGYRFDGGILTRLTEPHYAKYHNRGTARIRKRRFFALSPQTRHDTTKSYANDLIKLIVGKP